MQGRQKGELVAWAILVASTTALLLIWFIGMISNSSFRCTKRFQQYIGGGEKTSPRLWSIRKADGHQSPTAALRRHSGNVHVHVYSMDASLPWSVEIAKTGATPSVLSHQAHCRRAAINASPFDQHMQAVGTLIHKGSIIHQEVGPWSKPSDEWVGVGRTRDQGKVIFGRYSQLPRYIQTDLVEYVSGFDWLIYKGSNVVTNTSNHRPIRPYQAARSAVGMTKATAASNNSRLIWAVVDGCEGCLDPRQRGLDLHSWAQLLLDEYELEYAINMDGGSSSTLIVDQRLVNHPHCLDVTTWITCQRKVATILCI